MLVYNMLLQTLNTIAFLSTHSASFTTKADVGFLILKSKTHIGCFSCFQFGWCGNERRLEALHVSCSPDSHLGHIQQQGVLAQVRHGSLK